MGAATEIAWTDHTFNPWWGCKHVSPGCDNCYAEAWAKRTGNDLWATGDRRFFSDKHWNEPRRWSGRVFCASMADVFEPNDALNRERWRLWELIDDTPNLTWQLLTKRPEQVRRLAPAHWIANWPEHVWLGTTVEDQERANLRIPRLVSVPGVKVRFLSCEPLLTPLVLTSWLSLRLVDWVICGGESGPHRREMDPAWAYDLRNQCAATRVPFFFKQVSALHSGQPGPDDLMIREFPR